MNEIMTIRRAIPDAIYWPPCVIQNESCWEDSSLLRHSRRVMTCYQPLMSIPFVGIGVARLYLTEVARLAKTDFRVS
jgi:hypothetical protein